MEGAPGKNEAGGYVKEEKNEDEDRETIVDVDAEKPQSSKVKEVKESKMEDVVGKSEAGRKAAKECQCPFGRGHSKSPFSSDFGMLPSSPSTPR